MDSFLRSSTTPRRRSSFALLAGIACVCLWSDTQSYVLQLPVWVCRCWEASITFLATKDLFGQPAVLLAFGRCGKPFSPIIISAQLGLELHCLFGVYGDWLLDA